MRQFAADLHRFFARRIVRGSVLVVFAFVVVIVGIATVKGHEPTADDYARYRNKVAAIEAQMSGQPPIYTPDGQVDGNFTYPNEPSDNRIKAGDMREVLQGTGVALLFLAFVLGASFIGADHNVGSLTTQLLYEPRRWRVHAGKAAAVLVGCAAVTLLSLAFLAGMITLGATLNGVTDGIDGEFWMNRLGQVARIVLACGIAGGMTYGVTLVLRRTSAGIVAFFLQYPLMFLIDPDKRPYGVFSKVLPLRGLVALVVDPTSLREGAEDIGIDTLAAGFVMTAVWIVVILAVSGRLFSRAEIR